MKIELTEEELNNLNVFMNRVDLKGGEAVTYLKLMQAVNANKVNGKKVPEEETVKEE